MRLDQAITQNAADPGAVMRIPTAEAEQLMPGEIVSASTDAPQYSQHPLSACFPPLDAEALQELTDDVKKNGLRNPIILYEGLVLDGWNRQLACRSAGFQARYEDFEEDDPAAFVISTNVQRRSLTASQRGAAVVAVRAWSPTGRPVKVVPGTTLTKTNAEMAQEAGTSESVIAQNKIVQNEGSEDKKREVLAGKVTAKAAAAEIRGWKKPQSSNFKKSLQPAPDYPKQLADLRAEIDTLSRAKTDRDTQLASAKNFIKDMSWVREADDPLSAAISKNKELHNVIELQKVEITDIRSKRDAAESDARELRAALAAMTKEKDDAVAAHKACPSAGGVLQRPRLLNRPRSRAPDWAIKFAPATASTVMS